VRKLLTNKGNENKQY